MLCLYHFTRIVYIFLFNHTKAVNTSLFNMVNCPIQSYPCMLKYHKKHTFFENVWPAELALFIYVSTHYDVTVK